MNKRQLALALVCAVSTMAANAADAKKEAAIRYAEDKQLCAEETSSSARMQCLRDAKAEYSKALKAASESSSKTAAPSAAAASTPTPTATPAATPAATSKAAVACAECGKVVSTRVVEKKGESTPLGMIAGGVAGAVLGHQVGGGRGKDVATIAGAAGGAYAGHKIEENMKSTKAWVVAVRFDDGTEREFSFAADPGYAAGDAVKQSGNSIARR